MSRGGSLIAVAQNVGLSVEGIFVDGAHANTAHWRFEQDHWMSAVVRIIRMNFAFVTKVYVVANRALVTNASNEPRSRLIFAQWAIAVHAKVNFVGLQRLGDGGVKRSKPMSRVSLGRREMALRAIIPVGACKAFVTHTGNMLKSS